MTWSSMSLEFLAVCSDVDGYAKAAEECLILCNIVGCRKVEAICLLKLASFWGDQDDPGPHAGSHD